MSDLWIPVIAALGGSLLTGVVAFGLEYWRTHREGKATQSERRTRAYSALLVHSGLLAQFASNLHVAMEVRSGLVEGLTITLGVHKALDLMELEDRVRLYLHPLYEAWSEVWLTGSKDVIAQANDLVALCGTVVGVATQRGEARSVFLRQIVGEKWTQKQLDDWNDELYALAEARRQFALLARKEADMEVADLFASATAKPAGGVH